MTTAPRDQIRQALIRDEDFRTKPYLDCCGKYWRDCTCAVKGKLSIGVGRNLDDVGLRVSEVYQMLEHDIDASVRECAGAFTFFSTLNDARAAALVEMDFNIGLPMLKAFPQMLAAMAREDWPEAAKQLLQSKLATEEKARAARWAAQFETGVFA